MEFVADAAAADLLLVAALDPDGRTVIVAANPGQPGLRVSERPLVDATRQFAAVTADSASVNPDAVWLFEGDGRAGVESLLDRGALAVACDCLGVAEAMLDATVAYAGMRRQFGRPIGSFQAVKHACADMLVQITHRPRTAGLCRGRQQHARTRRRGSRFRGPSRSSARLRSTLPARRCNCTAASATPGKAACTRTSNGRCWIVPSSGRQVRIGRASPSATGSGRGPEPLDLLPLVAQSASRQRAVGAPK